MPFDETQITSAENRSRPEDGDPSPTLASVARPPAIAFHLTQDPIHGEVSPALSSGNRQGCATAGVCVTGDVAHTLTGEGHDASEDGTGRGPPIVTQIGWRVRRLTPMECERLQGFPDGHTAIGKDSPRYKAVGNSMAVPVMRWIGKQMARVA